MMYEVVNGWPDAGWPLVVGGFLVLLLLTVGLILMIRALRRKKPISTAPPTPAPSPDTPASSYLESAGAPDNSLRPALKPESTATERASENGLAIAQGFSGPEASAPLPQGALLQDGRYAVMEVYATNERRNTYLVEDTRPLRPCPNCHEEVVDPREQRCPSCGADLSEVEPLPLRYLMDESTDEQAFAVEAQLLGMHLEHPGLLLPCEVFTEAPYGPPRHYRLRPEFPPSLATSITIPQPLDRVLEWGISLAQALDYLHNHKVVLQDVNLDRIAVAGKKAHWTHLNTAHIIPSEDHPQAANLFSQDVQELSALLYYLATGRLEPSLAHLPEQVTTDFSQALTAAQLVAALEAALEELHRPASVTFVVGHRTDVGQERSLNEDSLLTLDMTPVYRSRSAPVGLFVIADGMGGHEAGDVASRLAIQTIARRAIDDVLSAAAAGERLPDARQWLSAVTQAANQTVYDQRKTAGTDMGTTLVMALVVGDMATIVNVGDSRAYVLRQDDGNPDHRIVQITTDHSLVERLVAMGQITPEEANHHPRRNIIYRVIGDQPWVEGDLFERRLEAGEALLLCSDGLSSMISDEQIWEIWNASGSPQEACDRLVEAANQAGGEDNITVVIVQVAK